MDRGILLALDVAQGPIFRCTFALLVLGVLRLVVLAVSDTTAAYMSLPDRAEFWRKLRLRLAWGLMPSVVLRGLRPDLSARTVAYHFGLCGLSLMVRAGAILVPAFMAAHVYLWERGLGVSWPALPIGVADVLAIITIVAGFALFLGRLYSPVLRGIEPPWSFVKPLVLILPFGTGFLAMHPLLSPFDYHFVMLLHVLSAALVFVLIPFARLLSCMHVRLTDVMPAAAWNAPTPVAEEAARLQKPVVS